jgi:hypothetical protein
LSAQDILRKFDRSAIVVVNGYSKSIVLKDWKHHLDSGKRTTSKGWVTGQDLKSLLSEDYIKDDEEVYLVVFRDDGKISAATISESKPTAAFVDSKPKPKF